MTSKVMTTEKTKSKTRTVRKPKSRGAFRSKTFLKVLPESMEHIEIVQQVAGVLEELQKRVLDVKAEASKELKKLLKMYEKNYKGIEKKVHKVTSEAKKQAQTSMMQLLQKWHEHKDKLPNPVAREIEKIIEQIGSKMATSILKKTAEKSTGSTIKKTKKKSSSIKRGSKKLNATPAKNEAEERVNKL